MSSKQVLFLKTSAEILKTCEKAASKSDVRLSLVETFILLRIVLLILITSIQSRVAGPRLGVVSDVMTLVMRNRRCWLMIKKMTMKNRRMGMGGLRWKKGRNLVLVLHHQLITKTLLFNNDSRDVIVRLKVDNQGILEAQDGWMIDDRVRGFVLLQLGLVARSLLPLPELPEDGSVSLSQSSQDVLQTQQVLQEFLLLG